MGYKHIKWNDEWIVENYLHYPSYKAMAEDHNKFFGTNAKAVSIKARARKLGLIKPRNDRYTEEQIEWLKENYHKYGCRKTAELFNEKFGDNRTFSSMKNFGRIHGVRVDEEVAVKNKLAPARAGYSKRKERPAGSTRMECGRMVMKCGDGTWKGAGKATWEKAHGKVPKGYVVTHLDGDTTNYALDNLAAVPLKHLGLLQKYGLRSECAEITKTGLLWCELHDALEKGE